MSEREELEADTLNMSQGEQSEWMGTDPYRWAHACIQHAKAAGPEFGEDADEATLDFVATWFASAMMAKSDAASRLPKGNGELPDWVHFCANCGRIIDGREKQDGGDDHGAEMLDDIWSCSHECEDALCGDPVPDKGNGELVEAVRQCVAYFEVMNVTGSLPDQCRKALSDSEEAAPVACDVPVWGRLREFVAHPDTTDAHRKDLQRLLFDFMADAHDPGETPLHGDGVRDDTEAVQERVNAGLTIGDSHE